MAAGTTSAVEKGHVSHLFGRDSLYMLMWAVQIICAAGLTPITTRVLGLAEFGTVTSANAVMQVLFVFAGLGLQTAVLQEGGYFVPHLGENVRNWLLGLEGRERDLSRLAEGSRR